MNILTQEFCSTNANSLTTNSDQDIFTFINFLKKKNYLESVRRQIGTITNIYCLPKINKTQYKPKCINKLNTKLSLLLTPELTYTKEQ